MSGGVISFSDVHCDSPAGLITDDARPVGPLGHREEFITTVMALAKDGRV